ncbi:MAG: 4Fe-4S binding protein [Desulfobacteraceae bacterium]|nr:4Fe-4S binding protein [Desulfobacteraceae bacterium]MBC2756575.1 4Fe-4S binding protein [Desulfobacteraceae bacterium]
MANSVYVNLWNKLDENFMTAPKDPDGNPQPSFMKFLERVYSHQEADLMQYMKRPGQFITTQELADAAGKPLDEVEKVMDGVHKRNGLIGMGNFYSLPPMPLLLNHHQFYPEVKPDDLEAAQLYQDFYIKDKYYIYYEGSKKGTPVFRTIPVEMAIEPDQKVLSAEEAHDFIMNHAPAEMALVPCPCRTRTEKMGIRECKDNNPVANCIMMGPTAMHFEMLGLGKKVTREEAVQYFDAMQELGLVGQTDNTLSDSSIICMCCGCCCSQLRGRTRWDNMSALLPANFIPQAGDDCVACGVCTERCFFGALSIDEEAERSVVDPDKCIGCGVCTLACPQETLKLYRHERSTPFNTTKEMVKTIARENRE